MRLDPERHDRGILAGVVTNILVQMEGDPLDDGVDLAAGGDDRNRRVPRPDAPAGADVEGEESRRLAAPLDLVEVLGGGPAQGVEGAEVEAFDSCHAFEPRGP